MPKVSLTKSEQTMLFNIISNKRGHYGLIKNQFSRGVIDYCRALNKLKKKLKS